jgi:hypothetical protein
MVNINKPRTLSRQPNYALKVKKYLDTLYKKEGHLENLKIKPVAALI